MKFAAFKQAEAAKPAVVTPTFGQQHGKRRMVRDAEADPWDLDCLDAKMCPDASCYGDLAVRLSPSGNVNIIYYECMKDPAHKYARVKTPKSMLTTGHMRVIAAAQESLSMQLDAASHRLKPEREEAVATDDGMPLVDHMGRLI